MIPATWFIFPCYQVQWLALHHQIQSSPRGPPTKSVNKMAPVSSLTCTGLTQYFSGGLLETCHAIIRSYRCHCVFLCSHAQLFGNQAAIRSLRLGRLPKGSKTQVFGRIAAFTESLSSEERFVAKRTFSHLLNRNKLTHQLISLTRFHLRLPQESMQVEDESTDVVPQTSHTQQSQEKQVKPDKSTWRWWDVEYTFLVKPSA